MTLRKIISGGQTGAYHGALDAALALGFPCGGWCPAARRAEDAGRFISPAPITSASLPVRLEYPQTLPQRVVMHVEHLA